MLDICLAIHGLIRGSSTWRKASKCKRLIERLKIRLRVLKTRQNAIIEQSRHDIAQLFKKGNHQAAIQRVDQLHKDQCKSSAYRLVESFCNYVRENLRYIDCHSKQPIEFLEAIASLTYAASRCGDLPELNKLRTLFKKHYGLMFDGTNAEMLQGNIVNSLLAHCLDPSLSLTREVKQRLIEETKMNKEIQLVSSTRPDLMLQ